MKNKEHVARKGIQILLLSLVAAIFMIVGAACGGGDTGFEVQFKDNVPERVSITKEIDLRDFVVIVPNSTYTVKVSYVNLNDRTVTEEFSEGNMAFYPKYSGEHKVVYAVTKGEKTKTAEMTFIVEAAPPTISLDDKPIVLTKTSEPLVRDLPTLLSLAKLAITPTTASVSVTKIEYRTVTAGWGDFYGDWGEVSDFNADEENYTFANAGQYKLVATVVNGDYTAEDECYVTVMADSSEGNQYFGTGKSAIYSEDNERLATLPAAISSELSYVVIDREFDNGEELQVVFKGKNIPQLGLYVTPKTDAADPYGINNANGILLSFVRGGTHKFDLCTSADTTTGEHTLTMGTGMVAKSGTTGAFDPATLNNDTYYMISYSLNSLNQSTTIGGVLYTRKVAFGFHVYPILDYGTPDQVLGGDLVPTGSSGTGDFWLRSDFPRTGTKAVIYGGTQEMTTVEVYKDPDERPKHNATAVGNHVSMDASKGVSVVNGRLSCDLAYIGIGEFAMGDTLEITFTGKNVPNVALFCDTNDGPAIGGGEGYFIGTSGCNTTTAYNSYFTCRGPLRLDPGELISNDEFAEWATKCNVYERTVSNVATTYDANVNFWNGMMWFRASKTETILSHGNLEEGVDYKWIMKASTNADNHFIYSYELYYKNSGETDWTKFNVTVSALSSGGKSSLAAHVGEGFTWENRYAIIYGTAHSAIEFDYNIIKAGS